VATEMPVKPNTAAISDMTKKKSASLSIFRFPVQAA
jgi:hypothetical protein